jgi:hypothetical protein
MNNKDFVNKLIELKACPEAIELVKEKKWTLKQAWAKTERADWMLWLMCKMEFATQRERIHIICDCAETSLKYVPKGEDRPRLAIEAARRYADNPTEKNREAAGAAAGAARAAAGAARAAAGAAWAAAGAAWAAAGAAEAAGAAAGAAWAAEAAAGAAGAAAGAATHKKMCKMIRKKIKAEGK